MHKCEFSDRVGICLPLSFRGRKDSFVTSELCRLYCDKIVTIQFIMVSYYTDIIKNEPRRAWYIRRESYEGNYDSM